MPQTKQSTLAGQTPRTHGWGRLGSVDWLYLIYLLAMTALAVARSSSWRSLLLAHSLIAALVLLLAFNSQRSALARFLHDWYPLAMFIFTFEQVARFSLSFSPHWQDHWVLSLEQKCFSASPNVWLARFHSRWLSEFMDLGYFSYYPMFPLVAGLLYARKGKLAFRELMLSSVVMHFLCFAIYLAFPTEGPRYALDSLVLPPRGYFFSSVVHLIQHGAGVHGNALPSSHVALAFLCVVFSWRYLRHLAPWLTASFVLIGAGAVYDGYHYPSDIFAGVVAAAAALAFSFPFFTPSTAVVSISDQSTRG